MHSKDIDRFRGWTRKQFEISGDLEDALYELATAE
jgi:hypothetical protein